VPEQDHPVGGQLMGSQPRTFGAAAKALVAAGYDVVDLNFGCPVGKVLGRCRGGFLLREPETALAMVDAVLQAVAGDAPVTIKLRRGYDDSVAAERAFFAILLGACERGIAAATVHPRTVAQKYEGPSRWSFLARCKREVGARTLLGSGDLFSAFDAVRMLQATGVDGATMARGCIGNPFVFAQAQELLAGRAPLLPSLLQRRAALLQHWQLAVGHYGGEAAALATVRMHAIKYAQFHPEPVWARERMVAVKRPEQLVAAVEAVFDPGRDGERRLLRPDDAVVPVENLAGEAAEPVS
jgi:nifR3 family TIM-barrel protein